MAYYITTTNHWRVKNIINLKMYIALFYTWICNESGIWFSIRTLPK